MTVATTTNRVEYTADGVLTTFAYPFKIFADGDLEVRVAGTLQTLTTDYTVTGAGNAGGGNVVFVTAPANSASIVILRVLALTQGTDIVTGDPMPADTLEDMSDRLTMIAQQFDETFKRAALLAKESLFE
ncbi:MAG: hypothetical protein ACE5JU_22480, partial [Candidatus Binatia bacterium]